MSYRIIIQARLNSSRLPHKMIIPFYEDRGILDLIIERLLKHFGKDRLVLATTSKLKDDILADVALKHKIAVFRGSENDVLDRFIKSAEKESAEQIIRVCADNPFILPEYIENLIEAFDLDIMDYLSYRFLDNTPIIKSHIGLFAEIMTLDSLVKVRKQTDVKIYHEHVTNYIYENPEIFRVKFLDLPEIILNRRDLRLTIDTIDDFNMTKELYHQLNG